MKIMDLIIEELNNNLPEQDKQNDEKWERLHSEQYQIIQTDHGTFHNQIRKEHNNEKC